MIFHSILFENQIRSINREVIDDLKIGEILGENTTNNLGFLSEKERGNRACLLNALKNDNENFSLLREHTSSYAKVKSAYTKCEYPLSRALLFANYWGLVMEFCNRVLNMQFGDDTPYLLRLQEEVSNFCSKDRTKEKFNVCKEAISNLKKLSFGIKVKDDVVEFGLSEPTTSLAQKISNISDNGTSSSLNRLLEYPELCEKLLTTNNLGIEGIIEFEKKYATDEEIEGIESISIELKSLFELNSFYEKVNELGLPTSIAKFTESKEIIATNAYDITLIAKGEKNIIPNDVELTEDKRLFFLSGANGGGKTTYLRLVGVNIILALNGLPVIAESMSLFDVDNLFTHFPHDENFVGEGRFANEKRRVDEIVSNITNNSIVLLNETYSTTNDQKSTEYTNNLAEDLFRAGAYGIYVTHATNIGVEGVGKLRVVVDKSDENIRTYKVAPASEESGSYASDILKKYSLDVDSLKKRVGGLNE